MTDWIKHNGGPRPVADDVKVVMRLRGGQVRSPRITWEHCGGPGDVMEFRIINDHLIAAARLEGIRLGLDAAAKTVCRAEIEASRELAESGDCHSPTEGRFAGLAEATDLIRALNPDTIAAATD